MNKLVLLFVLFGFLKSFKPSEPFLSPFLVQFKHLTKAQVNNEVYPIWDYSHLIFVPIVALLAEFAGYKIVIFLEAAGHMLTRISLLFGQGLFQMQMMQVTFALGTASDLVYYAAVFRFFIPSEHQKMTSLSRSSVLFGHCIGSLIGQLLLSFVPGIDLQILFWIAAVSTGLACLLTPFFPSKPLLSDREDEGGEQNLLTFPEIKIKVFRLISNVKEFFSPRNLKYYLVPLLFYSLNLLFLYLVETYSQSLWYDTLQQSNLDHDSQKMWNGYADCGGRGMGAIGSLLIWYALDKMSSKNNYEFLRSVAITITMLVVTAFVLAETLHINTIIYQYLYYIIYVGGSGAISSAVSAWLGSEISKLPKYGRDKHALIFAMSAFLSASMKALLQFVTGFLNPNIYTRFWIYTGLSALLTFLFLFNSIWHGLRLFTGRQAEGDDEEEPLLQETKN